MKEKSTYNAFISYSRQDETVAEELQKFLNRYLIPRSYRRNRNRFNVFRDIENASLGELNDVLKGALDSSEFLIVLCSPNSKNSRYVSQEIAYFGQKNGKEKVIPVIISGRPNHEISQNDPMQDQAFSDALYNLFEEPLAADLRIKPKEGRRAAKDRLREARFQIIAKLLQTEKTEELVGREKRKRVFIRLALSVLLILGLSLSGWWYYDHIPKAGISLSQISQKAVWGQRAKEGVKALRAAARAEIPSRRDKGQLLIATWNIRHFGRSRFSSAKRSQESLFYIAEIISRFDIIALQELTGKPEDFDPVFKDLQKKLGRHWKAVVSGITEGRLGNQERLGFLYDSRKLRFGDFTDEIVIPASLLEQLEIKEQPARTPFMAGFYFGTTKLIFCNLHTFWGSTSGSRLERRHKELEAVISSLAQGLKNRRLWADKLILLGTFHVMDLSSPTLLHLKENGFLLPAGLEQVPTNMAMNRPYDQIALWWNDTSAALIPVSGGAFDFYKYVYRKNDEAFYAQDMGQKYMVGRDGEPKSPEKKSLYYIRYWRAYQMSDHLPKWLLLTRSQ
jgi:hypothetical protein